MSKTIILIHGAWLTPSSLDLFRKRYESRGYDVLAPAWPLMDAPADTLRDQPDPRLGGLTLGRIVDHYAGVIASLPEAPILIGHSYGGLVVQMLLDRGLGAAGVSIEPAPAAGIKPGATALAAAFPVFAAWAGWRRVLRMKRATFGKYFANDLPRAQQDELFAREIVPAPGRIYYQSVLGLGSAINWKNPERAPLLLISATGDKTIEPSMVRQNLARYATSPALTAFKSFAGRSHFLIAAPGWEEVADYALGWAQNPTPSLVGAAARPVSGVLATH